MKIKGFYESIYSGLVPCQLEAKYIERLSQSTLLELKVTQSTGVYPKGHLLLAAPHRFVKKVKRSGFRYIIETIPTGHVESSGQIG